MTVEQDLKNILYLLKIIGTAFIMACAFPVVLIIFLIALIYGIILERS